jgi:hypothetical protein
MWMCPHHYHGYFDDAEDMIPGLPDDDDTEHPENAQNAEDTAMHDEGEEEEKEEDDEEEEEEEEEEEDEEEHVNDSDISSEGGGWWPTCEQCGAEEETRPFPNKGWICIDCKYRSGTVEPAPESNYAPSDVEYEPLAEAEGIDEPEVEDDLEGEYHEPDTDKNEDDDHEHDEDEPEAKRRRL